MKKILLVSIITLSSIIVSCTAPQSSKMSKEDLEKMLNDHPDILSNWIEKNGTLYVETSQKAFRKYNEDKKVQDAKQKQQSLDDQIKNPLAFKMDEKRALGDVKSADIKVIEYSDFECPFCSRGYATVKELEKNMEKRLAFEYRHLPLPFHPHAMPAALAFESIMIQDKDKAYKFHDELFSRQGELKEKGDKLFTEIATKLKVDMKKMKKDMESDAVKKVIEDSINEARKYGISGTPGFLVNGVLIKGAYPTPYFDNVISKTTSK